MLPSLMFTEIEGLGESHISLKILVRVKGTGTGMWEEEESFVFLK